MLGIEVVSYLFVFPASGEAETYKVILESGKYQFVFAFEFCTRDEAEKWIKYNIKDVEKSLAFCTFYQLGGALKIPPTPKYSTCEPVAVDMGIGLPNLIHPCVKKMDEGD